MEILFISHKYPPSIGGMEKQSYELIKGMESHARVHKIVYTGQESRVLFFLRLKARVKKLLSENPGIQLIHLNDGLMAAATLWLKKITDIPIVATVHGLDIVFPLKLYQKWIVPKFNQLDGLISVSKATGKACIKRGIKNHKVFTVNNGVNKTLSLDPIDKNIISKIAVRHNLNLKDKKILISIGRPVKRKGFSWFLKHVVPSLPEDIYYLMVGPIGEKSKFHKTVRSLIPESLLKHIDLFLGNSTDEESLKNLLLSDKLVARAHHLGKLEYQELVSLLAMSDIFVMPNIIVDGDMEGFGLVALEAALSETLVVASGIEGITDAVCDHKNGQLVRSGNSKDWISVLTELIQSPQQISQLSKKAKLFTQQNYSWEKMSNEYSKVFEEIIESKLSEVESPRSFENLIYKMA